MYDTLESCINKADIGINIGSAIVFECVNAITTIYPNSKLIEVAAGTIGRFITSSTRNLKYLGIQGLTNIVKINPKYATQQYLFL
jgi:AP-4 complex subunit epsilon-1